MKVIHWGGATHINLWVS